MAYSFNEAMGFSKTATKKEICERNIILCEKDLDVARMSGDVMKIKLAKSNLLKTKAMYNSCC